MRESLGLGRNLNGRSPWLEFAIPQNRSLASSAKLRYCLVKDIRLWTFAIDSKRLSQTDVWHHFWPRCGFPDTEFDTGAGIDGLSEPSRSVAIDLAKEFVESLKIRQADL